MEPREAVTRLAQYLYDVAILLNTTVSVEYTAIAAAATVKIGSSIQFISGAGTISTISVAENWIGPLYLISVDGFSYDAAGNIASTGTVPANTHRCFIWEGRLWYPAG